MAIALQKSRLETKEGNWEVEETREHMFAKGRKLWVRKLVLIALRRWKFAGFLGFDSEIA